MARFFLAGWEEVRIAPGDTAFVPLAFVSYPISHSLLAVSGWATVCALFHQAYTRYQPGAIAIFTGVLSHWFLDAAAHRPDLPLYPGGSRIGLGFWDFPEVTILVETFVFLASAWVYAVTTVPRNRVGVHSPPVEGTAHNSAKTPPKTSG